MAKRRRLTPPRPEFLDTPEGLETKSAFPLGVAPTRTRPSAPIAGVAGEASASAALAELSAEIQAARAEGRLVQALPLAAVEVDYLVRDRLSVAEDEMAALKASLLARGQQTPIETVALADGRFGLISGWRRLAALRALHAETGEDRFATIQALIRSPGSTGEAYVAMIEENEIRVGLSYFERARIVARAVEEGVYADEGAALSALFASASRAKRSKIRSFLPLVAQLGAHLRFAAAISERQGLDLAQKLKDPGFATRLKDRLRKATPESVEAEQALLTRALGGKGAGESGAGEGAATPVTPTPKARDPQPRPAAGEEVVPGVTLQHEGDALILKGPGLSDAHVAAVRAALKAMS